MELIPCLLTSVSSRLISQPLVSLSAALTVTPQPCPRLPTSAELTSEPLVANVIPRKPQFTFYNWSPPQGALRSVPLPPVHSNGTRWVFLVLPHCAADFRRLPLPLHSCRDPLPLLSIPLTLPAIPVQPHCSFAHRTAPSPSLHVAATSCSFHGDHNRSPRVPLPSIMPIVIG